MTIDTKRLASDPGYWDELKAPEDATHACIYLGGKWKWMKVNLSGPFNYYWHQRFSEWQRQESEVGERIIPRPQKPEVEWDKDLPDVGAEKQYYNSEMNEVRECVVIAHRHGCAVVEDQDGQSYEAVPPNNFVRTKEQQDRDELLKVMGQPSTLLDMGAIADAILSRYNLELKK